MCVWHIVFTGRAAIKQQPGWNRQMTMMNRLDARRQQMLIDLQREMADLVESGDMTANEANEWVNRAADRWAGE